jgi:nucleoside-diphosphate-sugar epimerase
MSGDGSDGLDFTYIEDLVDGLTRVVELEESRNQVFNLTYGSARTIAEMVDILRSHFPSVTVKSVPKDTLMPDRGTLNIDKARSLLGYNPSWPLDSGYPKYIQWYRDLFARQPEHRR